MMSLSPADLRVEVEKAVKHFWSTRTRQSSRQKRGGRQDQGARGAVTGGAQMDGFVELISRIVQLSGALDTTIHRKKKLELPGYFRATKEWDLLVVAKDELIAVIEVKSQIGPSFGNNFNNRTEEAIGSAFDLWTAYREGAFRASPHPWLGYLFLLEDCESSIRPVSVQEPHFSVFPEFRDASYAKRYEIFCRKLVRERQYDAAAFLMSNSEGGKKGLYSEPADDLRIESFARSLYAHTGAYFT